MATWIEVKVRYDKMMSNGCVKKVTEAYLVDALSCTEAEARVIEELRPFVSGDLRVTSVTTTKIAEIFGDATGDRYYKVKVNFITLDEKSSTEKKTASYILVQASSFKEAYDNFEDGMSGTMADYEIEQICETKLMDVYKSDLTPKQEAEKMLQSPAVKRQVKKFVDACAEGGVESVEITASDGKSSRSYSINIPDQSISNDHG
ncbi:MAG: DUF4494 domain-containing protein [Bacteroidales bacterium]|nr:DUF4494 domain-containing protein [Bacteroidales bacterium]